MTKLRRQYTQKTLKILFGSSGNQCAHPECINNVIEPATEKSDAAVIAQICHIYAFSTNGPRGKAGLTNEELNSPENLILLCPNHHTVVDKQHETYPVELLKQWKREHEAKVRENRISAGLDSVWENIFSRSSFPKELIDKTIKDETDILRKSRFFPKFDRVHRTLTLVRKLLKGELSGGADSVRCRALAWCVRILSIEDQNKAEEYLKLAKELGTCQEIDIADAFISSQKGDKNAALSILADLDSPMSRSAALMVVAHHNDPQDTVDWLRKTGIDAKDLDSDGKYFLLGRHFELADWEAAQECLGVLTDDDLHDAPVLHHMVAMTHLLSTVPDELRSIVLNQLLLDPSGFPLASDAAAIEARRVAHQHFINAVEVARLLNLPRAVAIADEYALWLELRDPDKSNKGRKRLESKLRDPESALHLVHLGLQFGIKLDLDAVEREIKRQIALNGRITPDAAIARLALALKQKTPDDVANYIARHYDDLTLHIDKKSVLLCRMEMLSKAGQADKANGILDTLIKDGLSEVEEIRFRRIISEAKRTDSVNILKAQFKETNSLQDLIILVDELETKEDWNGLCEYGEILFEKTDELRHAESLALALYNTQQNERLVEFLESNKTLLAQSEKLQMLYCWSLFFEGSLLEARAELAKLNGDWDDENYRTLRINLAVYLGDWNSLSAFVAKECKEKDKRNSQELIGAALLALRLDSIPQAKELIFTAATKGDDDADILGDAYFLATRAGWEDENVFQWMHKAAALSGDDGPIRKMTLKDLVDQKPEWDRRASEIWEQLRHGEIPMFLAAEGTNNSLSDLMLFPALANPSENDSRRRVTIPAYSGQRHPLSLDTNVQIGMDVTALLTLSFLNLLDEALDAFDIVHIPHSTLVWLFDEKQGVVFHQPSRIQDAHKISHLLNTGALEQLSPSTVPNSDLSAQVGDELARLIAEAEKVVGDDDTQRIVVRSSPVHRIASLMEEEADLTAHATVLSSCQAIVDKVRQKGRIMASAEQKARAYLQLHEKPWPDQPEISDGAILYLDDLAITYFLHLGILEKLQTAGFKPIVSPRKVSETNQLISYERISGEAKDAIERIRSALNSRIESGKIQVGRQINTDQPIDQSMSLHPTFGIFSLAKGCDVIISDDRFLNQHPDADNNGASMPVFSTLELIDALVSIGAKTAEDRLGYRTRLRQAGYIFVPVSEDELAHHLNASMVEDGKVVETAELRAIRENILQVRMSTWLHLPEDASWLVELQKTFFQVLKDMWKTDANFSDVRARSNWILAQIDIRGWAHQLEKEIGYNIVTTGRSAHILWTLVLPVEEPQKVRDEYWNWVEGRVLDPLKEQYPDLYSWIVKWYRRWIAEMTDMDLIEGEEK